ncbi:MAG: hypothetical protein DPW13_06720 [Planctomycetes bacterium]|nr:hypothetical protein [Planctomycetota bacterium]
MGPEGSVEMTEPANGHPVLPDGNGGFMPCPSLLSEEEAIRYLRLDATSVRDPRQSLRYYRQRGLLKATRVGRCLRYRRVELDRFLERLTETRNR